jgi:hypothetical protein
LPEALQLRKKWIYGTRSVQVQPSLRVELMRERSSVGSCEDEGLSCVISRHNLYQQINQSVRQNISAANPGSDTEDHTTATYPSMRCARQSVTVSTWMDFEPSEWITTRGSIRVEDCVKLFPGFRAQPGFRGRLLQISTLEQAYLRQRSTQAPTESTAATSIPVRPPLVCSIK